MIVLLFLINFNLAYAGLFIGTGVTNITGGRIVPALHTGYDSSQFALTLTSVGVKNSVYYHSGYLLNLFSQTEMGDFWWGKLRAGIGGGVHFAKRSYTDGSHSETKSDFALGPSMRATWEFLPSTFLGIEALYGIRGVNTLALVSQRVILLNFGVRF